MRLGFVGLGSIGAPIARHLIDAGHALIACDLDPDGAAQRVGAALEFVRTPADVGNRCETVLVCLPTPDAVESVALGAGGLIAGTALRTYADLSTTGPVVARKVASRLAKAGIVALDAPISGGTSGARAGTLTVMGAGDSAAFERCRPVFSTFAANVFHLGTQPGQGHVVKLVNNAIGAANVVVVAEALAFCTRKGIALDEVLNVLNCSTARSYVSQVIAVKNMASRRYDYGHRLELLHKDVRLFLAEADDVQAVTTVARAVECSWQHAVDSGAGHEDMTAILRVLEQAGNPGASPR